MAERTSIGLIGCGGMMGAHEQGFKILHDHGIDTFDIVATCDVRVEAAEAMADKIAHWQGRKPRVYTDVETMLREHDDLQAVDIVTTHRAHHTVAEACFAAGKHVTIEKPLAITLRAGKQMLAQAEKAGTVFQVAENYRRDTENRAFKWATSQGMIGDIRMIYWIDVEERLWYWQWRDHVDQAGGGWALDGGVHFADLFRYHIGDPVSMFAGVRTYNPTRYKEHDTMTGPIDVTIEDTTLAVVSFPNNVIGQWTYSLAAPGFKFRNRALYGDSGALVWHEGLRTRTESMSVQQLVDLHWKSISDDEREKLFPRGITDTIATELHEFIEAVQGRGEVEMTGIEGYRDEVISMMLYESHALGRPVTFDEVADLKVETYQNTINNGLEGLHS
jgi:predicted dehydrogenase